jgi:hypothetical protein
MSFFYGLRDHKRMCVACIAGENCERREELTVKAKKKGEHLQRKALRFGYKEVIGFVEIKGQDD